LADRVAAACLGRLPRPRVAGGRAGEGDRRGGRFGKTLPLGRDGARGVAREAGRADADEAAGGGAGYRPSLSPSLLLIRSSEK
jgi:hypothetical protein